MRDLNGIYRGLVVSNNDPKKIGRVQVRVYTIHGDKENGIKDEALPWAFPCFPYASFNAGSFIVPEVNNVVFIMFENGDSRSPVYLGSTYGTGRIEKAETGNTDGRIRHYRVKGQEVPVEASSLDTKVLYKSPKGNKIIIQDEDGCESISIVDASGQALKIEAPLSSDYTDECVNADADVTKGGSDAISHLVREATILLQNLNGSLIRMASSEESSTIYLRAEGPQPSAILLDGYDYKHGFNISCGSGGGPGKYQIIAKKDSLKLKSQFSTIELTDDSIIMSSKHIKLVGEDISYTANSIVTESGTIEEQSSHHATRNNSYTHIDTDATISVEVSIPENEVEE